MMRAILLTHLRLLLRSWGFRVLVLGGVALTVVATRGATTVGMFAWFSELVFPFVLLGQMLLTTAAAGQERSERVAELIDAMPYRAGLWVVGRYLVHFLVWLAVSVALWLTGALMVLAAGETADLRMLVMSWAVMAPVSIAFTTAVGFVVAHFTSGVLAYILTVAVWVSGPFVQLVLTKESHQTPVPVLEYFASGRTFALSPIGYFPNGLLLAFNRLFLAAVAVAGLGLIIRAIGRRRGTPVRAAAVAALLGVVVAAGSYAGAAGIWQDRKAAVADELKQTSPSFTEADREFVIGSTRLDLYDLQVRLAPNTHRMAVRASFDVTNPGAEPLTSIEMSLRTNFEVKAITDGSGRTIPFSRAGDGLALQMPLAPGATVRVAMDYEGEVWQWRWDNGPKLAAHIAPDTMMLPAGYAWYPIAGKARLTANIRRCSGGPSSDCVDHLDDMPVAHPPATFTLKVDGWERNLVSNAGEPVTGLFLVGTVHETVRLSGNLPIYSPFPENGQPVDVSGIEITVAPANRARAERMAAHAARRIHAYESLVPLGRPTVRIVETPDSGLYGESWSTQTSVAPNTLLLFHREIGTYVDRFLLGSSYGPDKVAAIWWPADLVPERHLYEGAAMFMNEVLFGLQTPAFVSDGLYSPLRVVIILRAVEQAKGREAAVQVLRDLRAALHKGGPTTVDFIESVNRVAADAPAVAELVANIRRKP